MAIVTSTLNWRHKRLQLGKKKLLEELRRLSDICEWKGIASVFGYNLHQYIKLRSLCN